MNRQIKKSLNTAPAERQSEFKSDDFEWSIDACDTNLSAWENEIEMNKAWEHSQVLIVYCHLLPLIRFCLHFLCRIVLVLCERERERTKKIARTLWFITLSCLQADVFDDKKRKKNRRKKSPHRKSKLCRRVPRWWLSAQVFEPIETILRSIHFIWPVFFFSFCFVLFGESNAFFLLLLLLLRIIHNDDESMTT